MTQEIKAIIYDCGNTLLKGRPTIDELCEVAFDEFEVYTVPEQLQAALPDVTAFFHERQGSEGIAFYNSDDSAGRFWRDYYLEAFRRAGLEQDSELLNALAVRLNAWYNEPAQWVVFDDAWGALAEGEKRGLVQGVVSDWGSDLVAILSSLGLTRFFDFVVASAVVGHAKPSTEIFRYALDRGGLQPGECVYVGDTYIADVLGARASGLTPVLVDRRGHNHRFDCLTITSLDGLFVALDETAGARV
ncbi:MAG: HAD-IA family hydrolase [Dehalococcoidia bacterium]|nr:HAD-IA family hydrolase [Dehalococcoidia bacterium]